MRVFISHSSRDAELALLLIELLRSGLNLSPDEIRCSSVEGYRLPAGASTDEVLRREVHDSDLFIGLITSHSIDSAYVLFELGARWGAAKTLIPLLAGGFLPGHLTGPLSGINGLNCSVPDQLHQLIEEAATHLNVRQGRFSTYQRAVEALASASVRLAEKGHSSSPSDKANNSAATEPRPPATAAPDPEMLLLKVLALRNTTTSYDSLVKELGFSRARVDVLADNLIVKKLAIAVLTGETLMVSSAGKRLAVEKGLV